MQDATRRQYRSALVSPKVYTNQTNSLIAKRNRAKSLQRAISQDWTITLSLFFLRERSDDVEEQVCLCPKNFRLGRQLNTVVVEGEPLVTHSAV
jgi:hypothetical protein